MNKVEYLLTCLAEECAELAKAALKANRFGLLDYNPNTGTINKKDIEKEYNDIAAILELLGIEGHIDYSIKANCVIIKQSKLLRYWENHKNYKKGS